MSDWRSLHCDSCLSCPPISGGPRPRPGGGRGAGAPPILNFPSLDPATPTEKKAADYKNSPPFGNQGLVGLLFEWQKKKRQKTETLFGQSEFCNRCFFCCCFVCEPRRSRSGSEINAIDTSTTARGGYTYMTEKQKPENSCFLSVVINDTPTGMVLLRHRQLRSRS